MMKKMLVLALVLAVAGLANAGLSFDKTNMANISIVDVAGGTLSASYYVQLTGTLVLDLGSAVTLPNSGLPSVKPDVIYQYPSFETATATSGAGQYFLDGFLPGSTGALTYTPNFVVAQGIKYVSGAGEMKLYTSDTFSGDVAASTTFVPEPMTMVLLGLGGLFLRKK